MASAPKIHYLDGSGSTQRLTITTNLLGLFFSGTVDDNTIDVQININGTGFVSDPTLVGLELPNFRVPNLASYPEGLVLEKGLNTIELRSIDISGSVSPVSTISVTVVSDVDLGVIQAPPTGIRIIRHATSIELNWFDPAGNQASSNIAPSRPVSPTGYNVYASLGSGGTGSGYLRLNRDIIPANSFTKTEVEEVALFDETFDLSDPSGNDLVILSKTVDPVTQEEIEQKSLATASLIFTRNFRLRTTVSDLLVQNFFSFKHDRNGGIQSGFINNDTFSSLNAEDPIFYVVTALYFNSATGTMIESRFSPEVSGSPLPLDTTVRGIRIRDRKAVTEGFINEVQKSAPGLSLIPGSTVREVHIEPFSNEIQKAYFLMDFIHRSKSFSALLQIDDPSFSGTSVPVSESPYKQNLASALQLSSDSAVQTLINGAFESLAKNFGINRGGLRAATVMQTFYTETKPIRDLVVTQNALVSSSSNTAAPRFRARGSVRMSVVNADKYYNPELRRYEIQVEMVAESAGANGNVPAGALDTVVSGASGLKAINKTAANFGRDFVSNLELAEQCIRAYSSVDSGTEGGYEKIAVGTPGLIEAKIVKSGDPYMMRDWDPIRKKHIGGKVDIYVKGTNERTVTENFAFQFSVAKNVRFDVIDADLLILRARDSRLNPNNPIQEILFNPSQDLGFRNHSNLPTSIYDLTGAVILDYRTVQLNTSIPQPQTLLDDFVEGDYRYRSNNQFIASIQPIRRVSSVIGEISGTLDPDLGFSVYKLEDPLLEGESTRSQDYVIINQVDDVPSGQSISVNDEQHVMIGQFREPLKSVGINEFSIRVYSTDRTILYNGPDSPNPDYLIIGGSQTSPISIIRSSVSQIATGTTVSVDYEHDENFSVTYVVNDVLQQLQSRLEKTRHVTADVLVKQAIENPLSTESTIQLKKNAIQSVVDDDIRTAITVLTDSKGIGESVYQSNVNTEMGNVEGVEFIVYPFPKFTLQDGAFRIREPVASDYTSLPTLNRFANAVYILDQPLPFSTIDGGGASTQHHGVFMDDLAMIMVNSIDEIANSPNQAWIIGSSGAVIPGYTDPATLLSDFPDDASDRADAIIARTANKILVSLNAGVLPIDTPFNHKFSATYVVNGDHGAKDISVSAIEYLTPGDLTLTYRSA